MSHRLKVPVLDTSVNSQSEQDGVQVCCPKAPQNLKSVLSPRWERSVAFHAVPSWATILSRKLYLAAVRGLLHWTNADSSWFAMTLRHLPALAAADRGLHLDLSLPPSIEI